MSSGDGGGGGINTTTIFKYAGTDQHSSGTQDNGYPQKWDKPHYATGEYSPDMHVRYHPDGTYEMYDPVLNTRTHFHTGGWQHHVTNDAEITNNPYEEHDTTAGHKRQMVWGNHDPGWGCHQRENFNGGRCSTHQGDVADFYKQNHYVYHSMHSRKDMNGGVHETRMLNGATMHSAMHDPEGQEMVVSSMTPDNMWMNHMQGNVNLNAGNMAQKPPKGSNMMITAQENTMHMNGKDHMITTMGKTMDQVKGGDHTTTASGKVILQKQGGMKCPALWPPSLQAG